VVTGRCLINYKKYGIVYPAKNVKTRFSPCDPADIESANKTEQMSPNILYPDTSYKIAKTIRDCNVEQIPLLIIADWRGFSGGTRDMFDQVLDFGSMIVSELAFYKQSVTIYIPPGGQLRGGSMVVFSKSINKDKIRFYIAESARINVLEPNATKELKYKMKDREKYGQLHGFTDIEKISDLFVELNDRVNPDCQILNQYERIVDGVVEPRELRDVL
jgi:acetyl-CoA carboxylase/biotin carboxylase 1